MIKKNIIGRIIININGYEIPWENLCIERQNEVTIKLYNKLIYEVKRNNNK